MNAVKREPKYSEENLYGLNHNLCDEKPVLHGVTLSALNVHYDFFHALS
jgi:hypothetical protein